jgi:Fe2+ or Zn2+ uptake regulation protein
MKQHRETKQRQIILNAVRARNDHPTADQIYLDVRLVDDKISRGTVYRNLTSLSEEGIINHVKVPGADRYDYRTDFHYHMICTECGSVIDVDMPYDNESDKKIAEKSGFKVLRHRMVFEGICPQCQKKMA